MSDEEAQDKSPVEARFEELRRMAEAIGCDLNVTLTVGGIRLDEVYRVYEMDDEDSLVGQLDKIQQALGDDRTKAIAEATERMVTIEGVASLVNTAVQVRQREYRIASEAFRAGFHKGHRPEDTDKGQEVIANIATIERERPISKALARMLGYERSPIEGEQPKEEQQPES